MKEGDGEQLVALCWKHYKQLVLKEEEKKERPKDGRDPRPIVPLPPRAEVQMWPEC